MRRVVAEDCLQLRRDVIEAGARQDRDRVALRDPVGRVEAGADDRLDLGQVLRHQQSRERAGVLGKQRAVVVPDPDTPGVVALPESLSGLKALLVRCVGGGGARGRNHIALSHRLAPIGVARHHQAQRHDRVEANPAQLRRQVWHERIEQLGCRAGRHERLSGEAGTEHPVREGDIAAGGRRLEHEPVGENRTDLGV